MSDLVSLRSLVPEGIPIISSWLRAQGFSSTLQQRYQSSGWLKSLGYGAVYRPETPLTWQRTLAALQAQGFLFHVGGNTALYLQGLGHYLPLGALTVHVYLQDRPPKWLEHLSFEDTVWKWHQSRLFDDPNIHAKPVKNLRHPETLASVSKRLGVVAFHFSDLELPLIISTPERASLELLNELPERESWETVTETFAGLVNLRPNLVMKLLKACTTIKTKRLFLVQGELHQHLWFNHLKLDDLDLGQGKRQVYSGGILHPKYQITVPKVAVNDSTF
jgi:Transcriptional regulator, AbiEi antitoxin, Type IV TA system/Transcriptional regulator, AbiEi antitoxin N-terminal domain